MGSSAVPVTKLSAQGSERWVGENFGPEISAVQLLLSVFVQAIHVSGHAESEAVQVG